MSYIVKIDPKRCKACELCVLACPKKILYISEKTNEFGFNVIACQDDKACTGCLACALICPDVAIEIYKESE